MTLPRKLRVSRTVFSASPKEAKRAQTEHFSLTTTPSEGGGLAAVVSKKVAKRSVDRHLLKRRMLEVMRPFHKENYSLIAYARGGSPSLPFKTLKAEFEELLSRV